MGLIGDILWGVTETVVGEMESKAKKMSRDKRVPDDYKEQYRDATDRLDSIKKDLHQHKFPDELTAPLKQDDDEYCEDEYCDDDFGENESLNDNYTSDRFETEDFLFDKFSDDFYIDDDYYPETDSDEDVRQIQQEAIYGNANAQYKLGWRYETGRGKPQDYTKAAHWYKKAARQNDTKALNCLP